MRPQSARKVEPPLDSVAFFTSRRERFLWSGVLAVVVGIYSTLGPVRTLADFLRGHDLLSLFLALIVAVLTVFALRGWIKTRPGLPEFGMACGVVFSYAIVFLRIENPAERTHLIEYGILAALIYQALLERRRNGHSMPWLGACTVGVVGLLGLLDECIQAFLPQRVFDWNDVFFNAFAGFMAVVARLALRSEPLPGWRLWFMWFTTGAIGWGICMDVSTFGEGRRFVILPFLPSVDIPRFESMAAGSILVGVFQWVLLRRYLTRSWRWLGACLGNSAAGGFLFFALGYPDAQIAWVTGAAIFGTLLGVFQWLVIRKQIARAGCWVLVSSVGWIATIPVGDLGGPPGWALYGAWTGAALIWLVRRQELKSGCV